MPSDLQKVVLIAACAVTALLPACSGKGRVENAAAVQRTTPAPDPRYPVDTPPRNDGPSGEWLMWVTPQGEEPAAGCYSKRGSEFIARAAAHTHCAANFAERSYYSVGGCTDPQRMAYATSVDGYYTWRACVDRRTGWQQAQAEAVKLCEAKSKQKCVAQWPLSDEGVEAKPPARAGRSRG